MSATAYVSLACTPWVSARSRIRPRTCASSPLFLSSHVVRRPRTRMCGADARASDLPVPPSSADEDQDGSSETKQYQAQDEHPQQRTQAQLLHDPPGQDYPELGPGAERPAWAPAWLPDVFLELPRRPLVQLALLLPLYAVHLFIFSTKGYKLPRPLFPNEKKLFQSIGWDSVVGAVVAAVFLVWRKFVMKADPVIPRLLHNDNPPWHVPRDAKRKIGQTTAFLVVAYLASGYGAVFIEGVLFLLASYGVPLTIATTRAWKVLLGHLMWVYMGIRILRRLRPFFPKDGTWLRWKIKSNWIWWAIGGYYVSALLFNFADVINQLVLPASLFEEETVVSKLINPENKDRMAMAIGSIGPCISAPVFEEVLYRGFLLPALACFLPMWAAIPASSVLFALHHLNPTGVLPLTVLGLIWAILYTKSRNLTVTILIHCMWNSRVFLGSLLGLGTFPDFE